MLTPIVTVLTPVKATVTDEIIAISLITSLAVFAIRIVLGDLRGVLEAMFILVEDILRWVVHVKAAFKKAFPKNEPDVGSEAPEPATT